MDAWVGSYETIHVVTPLHRDIPRIWLASKDWLDSCTPLPTSRPHLYYVGHWRLSYVRRKIKYDHDEMFMQTLARNFKRPQTEDDHWIVVKKGWAFWLLNNYVQHLHSLIWLHMSEKGRMLLITLHWPTLCRNSPWYYEHVCLPIGCLCSPQLSLGCEFTVCNMH